MPETNRGSLSALELTRQSFEAANSRDYDAIMSSYAADSVWDISPSGLGKYSGPAAIRRFFEDWIGSLDRWGVEVKKMEDRGDGVVVVISEQTGWSMGGGPKVSLRHASVFVWYGGVIATATHFRNMREARAAADRLAEERE
jgi:ketosteroid isomerase-like protein